MKSADQQRKDAAEARYWDKILTNTDNNDRRMAGVALASMLVPTIGSMVDNQSEDFGREALSGALSAYGLLGGAYLGADQMRLNKMPDGREDYIRSETEKLKTQAKLDMQTLGPEAANAKFADAKARLINDVNPIFRNADPNNFNLTPRTLRGGIKGGMIGGLASVIPAYLMLRGGEIE